VQETAVGGAPPDVVAALYATTVGRLFAEVKETGAGHRTVGGVGN
jgi:hypothetical protein